MPLIKLECVSQVVLGALSAHCENFTCRILDADLINTSNFSPAQRQGRHVIEGRQDHVLAVDLVLIAVAMRVHYEEVFEGACICIRWHTQLQLSTGYNSFVVTVETQLHCL